MGRKQGINTGTILACVVVAVLVGLEMGTFAAGVFVFVVLLAALDALGMIR